MGFLDKAKQAAEQAATRANEAAQDVQARRELQKAYADLGEIAYRLTDEGQVSHPELEGPAATVRELRAKLGDDAEPAEEMPEQEAVEQPLSGADLPTG